MSRKSKSHRRSRKSKRSHRRTRRQGGADALSGAPLKYHLAGSWASKMSLGQGADYFKYHQGQHGGAGAPFPNAVTDSLLPGPLRGPAHIGGIDAAIAYSRQFKDQAGGKRRRTRRSRRSQKKHRRRSQRSRRSQKKQGGRRRSQRSQRKQRRSRGGSLGYAPFPNKGMLLDSKMAYSQAGLNPQWKTDVAFDAAAARQKISP